MKKIDVTNEELFDFPDEQPEGEQHGFSFQEFKKWLSKEKKKEKEAIEDKVPEKDQDKENFKNKLRNKRKKS